MVERVNTILYKSDMAILQERARAAIKQHGGLRKAAQALKIDHSTLLYLAEGKRLTARPKTLRRLGLEPAIRSIRGAPGVMKACDYQLRPWRVRRRIAAVSRAALVCPRAAASRLASVIKGA